MTEHVFGNIREVLGPLIGRTLLDITQHDPGEANFVQFHFDDGSYVKFVMGEVGFHHNLGDDEEGGDGTRI